MRWRNEFIGVVLNSISTQINFDPIIIWPNYNNMKNFFFIFWRQLPVWNNVFGNGIFLQFQCRWTQRHLPTALWEARSRSARARGWVIVLKCTDLLYSNKIIPFWTNFYGSCCKPKNTFIFLQFGQNIVGSKSGVEIQFDTTTINSLRHHIYLIICHDLDPLYKNRAILFDYVSWIGNVHENNASVPFEGSQCFKRFNSVQ